MIGLMVILFVIVITLVITFLCIEYRRCKDYIKNNAPEVFCNDFEIGLFGSKQRLWAYKLGMLLHKITADCGSVFVSEGSFNADMVLLKKIMNKLSMFNDELMEIEKESRMIRRWEFLFCRYKKKQTNEERKQFYREIEREFSTEW